MAEKLDPKQVATFEELLRHSLYFRYGRRYGTGVSLPPT